MLGGGLHWGQALENSRVVRVGAWNNKPDNVRAANRNNNNNPDKSNNNIGFRLSKTFFAGVFSFTEEESERKSPRLFLPGLKAGQRGEKSRYGVDSLERYRDFFP